MKAVLLQVEHSGCEASAAVNRLSDLAADALAGEALFPERFSTTVLSMQLVSEVHRTIHEWTKWMATQLDVLESEDEQVIADHTKTTATRIRDARVDLPD